MQKPRTPPVIVRRYPVPFLSDVVYFVVPMPRELAETIRMLRRDYGISYPGLGYYLCETDPDAGTSFGLGRALTDIAARTLDDHDPAWT